MVYLFIGQDSFAKDAKLNSLKQEVLEKGTELFNLDLVYPDQAGKKQLQEKLLFFPAVQKKRMVVLKQVDALKQDSRDFIAEYVKNPRPQVDLILDVEEDKPRSAFLASLKQHCRIFRFKENIRVDTFILAKHIVFGRSSQALSVLNQLLAGGERPERIIGGLRYSWEKYSGTDYHQKKRLRLLLECDLDIKTGRIRPELALEKLVVSLSCAVKPLR